MGRFKLDARTRLSIDIALAAARGDGERLSRGEEAARVLGLAGAELDALCKGSSFDFRMSRAVGLALSPHEASRDRARHAGLDQQVCAAIEAFAAALAHNRA